MSSPLAHSFEQERVPGQTADIVQDGNYDCSDELSSSTETLRGVRLDLDDTPPIYKLLPELLNTIFTLLTQELIGTDFEYIDDKPVSATTLASVCSRWRSHILGSPIHWSNLKIFLTGRMTEDSYEQAQVWAQRSRGAPLWITIRDISDIIDLSEQQPSRQSLPESAFVRMIQFLNPLMPFARSLSIQFLEFSPDLTVRTLLASWIQAGSPNFAERLELLIDPDLQELEVPVISPLARDEALSPAQLSRLFASLRAVHIENVAIDWAKIAFADLTHLHLEFGFESRQLPSQQDISRLLAASPRLQSLIIFGFTVTPSRPVPAPVALDHLQQLGLESMSMQSVGYVLPLISSSSDALRMAISMGDEPAFVDAARSFLARTKVTVLHADGGLPGSLPSISALFVHMPPLHTLTLSCCVLSEENLGNFIAWRTSRDGRVNPWPALRTLNVFQCTITPDALQRFVEPFSPQTLGLWEPIPSEEAPPWRNEWDSNARAQLEESLSRRGINVVWYESSGDTLPSWSFVMS
ncbi:F-box-like domain-containing protein [Ceratobasidium sp. AG-Ba]|nr:F-box-like domain-containing protein [Ceratobasidium sp. AG-Ba]